MKDKKRTKEHTQVYGKPEPELLPCPFCGAKAMLEPDPDEPGVRIGCSRWSECIMDTSHFRTRELAIKAWNTRAK